MFEKTRNSISQRPKPLDSLSAIGATDLTEDQMQAYSGGETRGVLFHWFSPPPATSNGRVSFPSDGPGRGGTISIWR